MTPDEMRLWQSVYVQILGKWGTFAEIYCQSTSKLAALYADEAVRKFREFNKKEDYPNKGRL